MSQAYIDQGIYPTTGFISGAPGFVPEFVISPAGNAATAQTIFVSVGGNDSNAGTISAPYATLQKAITKRLTIDNAIFVTINVLTGTYTTPGLVLTIPDNTALIGVPIGKTSPVIFNGVLSIGSGVVNAGQVIVAGLTINGEVQMPTFYSTFFMSNCIVTSPGIVTGPYTSAAFSSGSFAYAKMQSCALYSAPVSKGVIQMDASNSLELSDCIVRNTYVGGVPAFPMTPVINLISVRNVSIEYSSVISDYTQTSSNAPIIYLASDPTSAFIFSLKYSSVSYTSSAADTLKACVYFNGAASTTATLDATVVGNLLKSTGGNTNTIINTTTNWNATLKSGSNSCASGSAGSSNITTRITLVPLSN